MSRCILALAILAAAGAQAAPTVISLPKLDKNITLPEPKNLTAIEEEIGTYIAQKKAVLEEAYVQNSEIIENAINRTKAELEEEKDGWDTEHDGNPANPIMKLLKEKFGEGKE